MATTLDQVKSWAAPALLAAVIAMGGFIWTRSEDRDNKNDVVVSDIAKNLATVAEAVAVVQENQRNGTENRVEFQGSMTTAVDRLNDAVMELSKSMAAETALRQERERSNP